MNYNHLHYFYMIVRHGSVSAASRNLLVSQPSLSAQIKTFEKNLGVVLFDRRANKLELTPAGKSIYSHAAQMFEISNSIRSFIDKSSHQNLPIHLGIADEVERPFAVNLVKNLTMQWKKREPPRISFTTGMNDPLLDKLRSWNLDAVISNRPSSFDDLETADTLVMPVFFAVPKNIESGMKTAANKDILRILRESGKGLAVPNSRLKLREEIDAFMSRERETPPITFESDTLATIVRAIIDNIGVGFVPLDYMLREVNKGEIGALGPKEGLWKHTVFLMVKRGRATAPGVAEITEAFKKLKTETY